MSDSFGLQGEILLQPAALAPGEPVLQRLNLATMGIQNTGSLRAASFDTRAETLAFNLVTCGSGDATELPCWLNHGRRVDRVGWTGDGRQQVLSGIGLPRDGRRGLDGVETLGPIIDAHIDARGRLWVLVRRPTEAAEEESVVTRYSLEDGLEGAVVVSSQSRLIIDVHDSDCVLLAGAGQFITIGIP